MNNIKAIIYDMDGLIVDSEPLWQKAEINIFAKVGIELTVEKCRQTMGLRIDEVVKYWHSRQPWALDDYGLQQIEDEVVAEVAKLIKSEGSLLPGVKESLQHLHGQYPLAIASSSKMLLIEAVKDKFSLNEIDLLCSAETEPYGKPHPGIFLTTAKKLAVEPTQCLVFEDSLSGVIAAKAARMLCAFVPNSDSNMKAGAIADFTIESLNQVESIFASPTIKS